MQGIGAAPMLALLQKVPLRVFVVRLVPGSSSESTGRDPAVRQRWPRSGSLNGRFGGFAGAANERGGETKDW